MNTLVLVALSLVSLVAALEPVAPGAQIIPDKYLIKLKTGVDANKFIRSQVLRRNNGVLSLLAEDVQFVYKTVFSGFSATLDESQLQLLESLNEVEKVEHDQVVSIAATVIQEGADWGTARVSSVARVTTPYRYRYDDSAGRNSRAYVLDTGIYLAHNEFGGRAVFGADFTSDGHQNDGHGHGTHCAGTIGGTTYGIAKLTALVAVKVLGQSGSGTLAGVVAGMDWAAANSTAYGNAVLSMSLGSSTSTLVNDAATAIVNRGIPIVAAAGNSAAATCNFSPAGATGVIAVGATTVADALASFSNRGSCTAILAPGSAITSAYIGSPSATASMSGTSMACPQVAGVVAYLRTRENLSTPAAILTRLRALAVSGAITGLPSDTPNVLLQNDVSV